MQDDKVHKLLHELISLQQESLLRCGQQFIPNLTSDDVLQPNDYPQLENNPHFRYEEGMLAGIQSVQAALLALERDAL